VSKVGGTKERKGGVKGVSGEEKNKEGVMGT
jgi:hypothetical protein